MRKRTREIFERGQRYIDIEPTWKGLVPSLVLLIDKGDSKGRKVAIEHMMQMASIADWLRDKQKRGIKMVRVPAEKKLKRVI
jgi:Tfp pilus assembly ATPase PilU